jgi:hypothetical protein
MKLPILCAIIAIGLVAMAFSQDKAKEPVRPTITLESLHARLDILTKERDQAIATVNAYDGAIQEVSYWINQLTPKEVKKDEPKRVEKPDTK